MPSPVTSHKDHDSVGRPIEPCGYIKIPAPPKTWSVTIDGHTITPRVIQRTLRRCRDAGVDMWYVAQRLGIGTGAIVTYMQRERSIPESVVKRFYTVFSSGEPLPKAPTAPTSKTIDWSKPIEPDETEKPNPWRRAQGSPDFDGNGLGLAVAQKRREAQLSLTVAARRAKCSTAFISSVEQGSMNYKSLRCLVLYRLCDILGVDIRQYELKPRIDYAKFRTIAREAMKKQGITNLELSRLTGMSDTWVCHQISAPKTGVPYVSYLEDCVQKTMDVLGLDLNEILLT